jgi:hypothetical protein
MENSRQTYKRVTKPSLERIRAPEIVAAGLQRSLLYVSPPSQRVLFGPSSARHSALESRTPSSRFACDTTRLIFRLCYSATAPSDHTIVNVSRYRAFARRRIEWPPKPFTKPLVRFAEAPPTPTRAEAPSRPPKRPAVIHSSLYLPARVYEALRQIAFDERVKIHDLVMQGIEAVLRKRGYASVDDLKSGKK